MKIYECKTHGLWDAAKESGCPHCVKKMRDSLLAIIEAGRISDCSRARYCADIAKAALGIKI